MKKKNLRDKDFYDYRDENGIDEFQNEKRRKEYLKERSERDYKR